MLCCSYFPGKRSLLVVPANVLHNWKEEVNSKPGCSLFNVVHRPFGYMTLVLTTCDHLTVQEMAAKWPHLGARLP